MLKEQLQFKTNVEQLMLDGLFYHPEEFETIVILNHGMAEHKERYIPFMEYLVNEGFAVCIYDHRGHGESVLAPKDHGFFYDETGKEIVKDSISVLEYFKENYPNKKRILFGHSMGSLVVRCVLKERGDLLDKLVVCGSPSANGAVAVAKSLVKAMMKFKGDHYRSPFIANLAMGAYQKPFKDEGLNAWLTKDKAIVSQYNQSDKCGFTFTLNGFLNLFTLMDETYQKGYLLNHELPILFVAGENDPVIESKEAWNAAINFLKEEGYEKIDATLYPMMRHEILNETSKELVYKDLAEWMKK